MGRFLPGLVGHVHRDLFRGRRLVAHGRQHIRRFLRLLAGAGPGPGPALPANKKIPLKKAA